MRRKWKDELKKAFEAPPPLEKKEFFEKYGYSKAQFFEKGHEKTGFSGTQPLEKTFSESRIPNSEVRLFNLILTQASYIRGWVWAVSALVFLAVLVGAVVLLWDMAWVVAALTPFLALAAVAEDVRSENYGMAEIEMATRFSLKSVVLARFVVLGAENLLVLCLLLPLGIKNNAMEPLQAGVYMLVPFLLTTYIGLCIVRRIREREGMYLCGGMAVCVSLGAYSARLHGMWLFRADVLGWWIMGIVLLVIGILKQYADIVKQTQEGVCGV